MSSSSIRFRSARRRLAPLVAVAAALVAAVGCGRANPRIDTITREEGGRVIVTTLGYDKDGHVANVRVVDGVPDEAPDDFSDYTWEEGKLTSIERTVTFDDFVLQTTTTFEYDRDKLIASAAETLLLRPEEDPRPISEEAITAKYDDELFIGLSRSFEDRDRNKATTELDLVYDVAGLIEVRDDTKLVNNGAPDVDTLRVTTIEYTEGRPTKLSVVENEGRATTLDLTYKGGVLELIDVAIPTLDEFNNEQVAEGQNNYRFDGDGRLNGLDIESDIAETIAYEIEYVDGDDEATGIDLMPAGMVNVPLWDLRGKPYDLVDARTQATRLLGATW